MEQMLNISLIIFLSLIVIGIIATITHYLYTEIKGSQDKVKTEEFRGRLIGATMCAIGGGIGLFVMWVIII